MKHIIEAFSAVVCIALAAFVSMAILTAGSDVIAAKEYKADVIAEIENSNFNQEVIDACTAQAAAAGYRLEIRNCTYDPYNDINTAEVILTYRYELPLLGISVESSTRGVAR